MCNPTHGLFGHSDDERIYKVPYQYYSIKRMTVTSEVEKPTTIFSNVMKPTTVTSLMKPTTVTTTAFRTSSKATESAAAAVTEKFEGRICGIVFACVFGTIIIIVGIISLLEKCCNKMKKQSNSSTANDIEMQQRNESGQIGESGQSGQSGQSEQSGQSRQSGQSGQSGQSRTFVDTDATESTNTEDTLPKYLPTNFPPAYTIEDTPPSSLPPAHIRF